MLKISSLFPNATKQKQTSTVDSCIQKNLYQINNRSTKRLLQSVLNQLSYVGISRVLRVSQPNKLNANSFSRQSNVTTYYNNNHQVQLKNYSAKISAQTMTKSLFYHKTGNYAENTSRGEMISFSQKNHLSNSTSKQNFNKRTKQNYKEQLKKQNLSGKASNFRIKRQKQKSVNDISFLHSRELKYQKHNIQYIAQLESSNLSQIYSTLYNAHEKVPFNQVQLEEQTDPSDNVLDKQSKKQQEGTVQQSKQEKRSFQMKELLFQKSLRKEIKSLTRDTDHILSLEFRDIRGYVGS